jgi:uncharacterized protein
VKRGRWFLPESPDVLGLLMRQVEVTIEGMQAFADWAHGDAAAAVVVHECEERADVARRELHSALRTAFVTPLEPEDLFALSSGIDNVLTHSKDAVRESEVMACPPDAAVAEMARILGGAARQLGEAIARLGPASGDATDAADAAIESERRLEHVYRAAMAALLELDDLREVTARRELYRRCSRIGESAVAVAERIQYAVVKGS